MGGNSNSPTKEVKYLVAVAKSAGIPARWLESSKGKGSYELTFDKSKAKRLDFSAAEKMQKAIPNSKVVKA